MCVAYERASNDIFALMHILIIIKTRSACVLLYTTTYAAAAAVCCGVCATVAGRLRLLLADLLAGIFAAGLCCAARQCAQARVRMRLFDELDEPEDDDNNDGDDGLFLLCTRGLTPMARVRALSSSVYIMRSRLLCVRNQRRRAAACRAVAAAVATQVSHKVYIFQQAKNRTKIVWFCACEISPESDFQ